MSSTRNRMYWPRCTTLPYLYPHMRICSSFVRVWARRSKQQRKKIESVCSRCKGVVAHSYSFHPQRSLRWLAGKQFSRHSPCKLPLLDVPLCSFHFHSMMLVSFQAFSLSSHCNSPSLFMMSCAAGKRTPALLLLSLSSRLISPAVRLKLFVCVFQ